MATATADFICKQGDTHGVITDTLTDADGDPVDITGASVKFVMRSLVAVEPQTNAAATIVDPSTGSVSYQPTAGDTAFAQKYMGNWIVTFSDTTVQTFPIDGYLDIWIEENLTSAGGQLLLSLPEAKQHLRINATDRSHDDELVSLITGITPVIESITGPVIVRLFDEWHDGGQDFIKVWHRPSTALGTSPVLNVLAVSEYNGPIEWPLALVASPDLGELYSAMVNSRLGTITRRTAGGGVQPFPSMLESVHVVYQAGQAQIPANVTECMREYLLLSYRGSQQAGHPQLRGGGSGGDDGPKGPPIGFALPGKCRELLGATRKAPSIG